MSRILSIIIVFCLTLGFLLTACTQSSLRKAAPASDASASEQDAAPSDQNMLVSEWNTPAAAPEGSVETEEAEALVFPNPRSEQFSLSEQDAVLFDAAIAAKDRTPNADICIPEISIYGTYKNEEQTIAVCHVYYRFYYGCDGTETYTDYGAMQTPAKAVLARDSAGTLQCVSFTLAPDGAGPVDWAENFCGPLTELRDYFLSSSSNAEWPLTNTMPSSETLFQEYIRTYRDYI